MPEPASNQPFPAAIQSIFHNAAIRYGIKFGLAGMLAVFIALVLRLQEPTWALFTVFVLMIAQYVGAIAEKSVFRLIGTIVGGIIGYVLTASLQQQPILYLTLVGLIVAFSTAMFGQSRYPYAFLLCGLTTVVVISNGLGNPDMSWRYMLVRVEEVGVGILSAVLVQSMLWPRFARVEFTRNAQAGFADLSGCFAASARILMEGGDPAATRRAEDFPARISALRSLLDFGARESQYFRNRLSTYFEITNCLSRIAAAIVTLGEALPATSLYRSSIHNEIAALHKAVAAALDDLGHDTSTPVTRSAHCEAIEKAFQALEERLLALRSDPGILSIPPREAMMLGIHVLALDEIRQQMRRAHELLDSLPAEHGDFLSREPEPFVSPIPPPFWIRSGVKSGIAVVIALVLDNWLQPPGGPMFILTAWVFTALNATSPGGQGDRRTFHYAVYTLAALILLSFAILAIRPLLSSYAVMNTILFTWLFVWGYCSYSARGMTIPMQVGMLALVGILGLNGQQPISYEAVEGVFFGMAFGLVLASVIQRLLWPSLPQWELRDRLVEFLQVCRRAIEDTPSALPLWQKTRIALIPGEADVRIGLLRPPICPADEPARLRDYLKTLQRVGGHLFVTIDRLAPLLPAEHADKGRKLIASFETTLKEQIEAHEKSMKTTAPFSTDPALLASQLDAWRSWIGDLRAWMLAHHYSILDALRILGLSGRYELAGRDLLLAGEQASRLRLPLYMGDYSL